MGRKSESKHCINCNMTLPDRYKGRQKIYCSNLCRKIYTANKPVTPKVYTGDNTKKTVD